MANFDSGTHTWEGTAPPFGSRDGGRALSERIRLWGWAEAVGCRGKLGWARRRAGRLRARAGPAVTCRQCLSGAGREQLGLFQLRSPEARAFLPAGICRAGRRAQAWLEHEQVLVGPEALLRDGLRGCQALP